MRIGIDARFYGGVFAKGLGRYTEKLLTHLDKLNSPHQFTVFLRQENWDLFRPIHEEKFLKILAPYRWYSFSEQIRLPRLIADQNIDLMHFPHFNVPLLYRRPFVVTIHDLIITHYPTRRATTLGPAAYALKQSGYHTVIKHAVKNSKKIIAVSKFTKDDIASSFKINPEKIAVTYEAADELDFVNRKNKTDVLSKFKIQQPYVLYVGNSYPHKNIEGLLRAFKIIKDRIEPNNSKKIKLQLVLVGKEDYFYKRIKKEAADLSLLSDVRFTDFVTDEELAALYENALIYCFPSLYEGFGLPPLEAMAAGLPVVSSNRSSLPEVLGEAAAYIDPEDIEKTAEIIYDVCTDGVKREKLKIKGYERVKRYGWERCARETIGIYEEVLS